MKPSARPIANDQGETLLELIIAVAIMGIAVVAIVGGIATSISMSDIHRKQSISGALVRDDVEALVTAGYKSACDYALPTAQPGYMEGINQVYYWNGSQFLAGCSDTGIHKVWIQVSSTDTRATERLEVVIRKLS
jgi:type II secretory pathway pseudopilin PulG